MTGHPSEKVDPAHWLGMIGGSLMMIVVLLCSVALWQPWWTESTEVPGEKTLAEASLWIRYTRFELEGDKAKLNCEKQCDFTKIGGKKVRENKVTWADACAATPQEERLADNCTRLWVVRVFTIICWFVALLFAAFSYLNFCGAGMPSSIRIPAGIKLTLAVFCFLMSALAMAVAALMEIRLEAVPPGTQPKPAWHEVESPKVLALNGFGFAAVLAAMILSFLGSGVAYLTQVVKMELDKIADAEQGRPLADIDQSKAPAVEHQMGTSPSVAPETFGKDESKPDSQEPPLGSWMKGR